MSEDGGNIDVTAISLDRSRQNQVDQVIQVSIYIYTMKLVIMDANIQARVHFLGQTNRLVLWVLHLSGASVENIVVVG